MPIDLPATPSDQTPVAALLENAIGHCTDAIVCALANSGVAVVPAAIPEPARKALRDDLHASSLRPASIGPANAAQRNTLVRSDSIAWMDGSTSAQQGWLAAMERLRCAINRELFLGLFDYESHYAQYQPGQFYRRHRDAFAGSTVAHSRVLSTICYLNDGWRSGDAGELVIFDNAEVPLLRVAPTAGTLVVFLSEQFPHEVLPAMTERCSIAGWFRRS